MEEGNIQIKLENVTREDTMRIKKAIDTLFLNDVFNIKGGWAKLSFDKDGNLGSIEKNTMVYRRQKEE